MARMLVGLEDVFSEVVERSTRKWAEATMVALFGVVLRRSRMAGAEMTLPVLARERPISAMRAFQSLLVFNKLIASRNALMFSTEMTI